MEIPKFRIAILMLLFSIFSGIANAEVFKCVVSGHISYSDSPCLSGSVPYAAPHDTIPGEPRSVTVTRGANGVYSLPGSIDGQSATFIVDTGATYTTISGALAYRLGIHSCQQAGITNTASGKAVFCRARISRLSIAGFKFSNIDVSITPQMPQDGLLGNDLLSTLKLTHAAGSITLSR